MKDLTKIEIKDGVFLVVEKSQKPFDKEVGIYLESNGIYQDVVLVSPKYNVDGELSVNYSNDELIVRLWEDENFDDYTKTVNIPLREEFK